MEKVGKYNKLISKVESLLLKQFGVLNTKNLTAVAELMRVKRPCHKAIQNLIVAASEAY